jgi:hypothetical protein
MTRCRKQRFGELAVVTGTIANERFEPDTTVVLGTALILKKEKITSECSGRDLHT